MKKKLLLSTVTAAAIMFSGAAFNKAEAAEVNCPTNQVTYKVATQQEAQKLIQQYFAKYNVQLPAQWKAVQAPTQQQTQQPAKSNVTTQKTTAPTTTNNTTTKAPAASQPTQTTSAVSAFEKKVVELTNAERAKQGLAPLTLDTELSKVARIKSQDMKDKNYFDHNSPTYGSPFDMMKSFGISYKSAGENIAMGQTSPEQVVQAWMNSQGHRENIMNPSFTHIGVGHVASGNYWTQQFIGK
jgi:uncharacterized YkwD family protein